MAVISGSEPAWPVSRGGVRATDLGLIGIAAALMLWPAIRNGFPLIFSDTGTYISQAQELHLGWDRPPFYSFMVLLLGGGRMLWPVVIAQCLLAAVLIRAAQRRIAPGMERGGVALLFTLLAIGSSLPWTAAEVMPDIFTPLMVLAFALLVLGGDEEVDPVVPAAVIGLAIMVHLSNLPIYAGLCLAVLPWRGLRGRVRWGPLLLPFLLGVGALTGVNVIASGRASPSPYGATFVLARLLENGPARATLARDCATAHWALCAYRSEIPATADAFLWDADSPLYRAGGPKRLIGQTDAIVARTVEAEPRAVLGAALDDFARQFVRFAPGSGLRPWYATAWQTIRRDLPAATYARFTDSLQARGRLGVPAGIAALDRWLTSFGLVLTAGFGVLSVLGLGGKRWRAPELGLFCVIVLLALAGNAVVTGALSGPHDRYQSRIVWLAVFSGALVARHLHAVWRSRPMSSTT